MHQLLIFYLNATTVVYAIHMTYTLRTRFQNLVMNVKLKITRFWNLLQALLQAFVQKMVTIQPG